jgi:hypothetical protein
LGFDIAQTLFIGPYVVVVEGPTEYALFHWFSQQLIKRSRKGLDIRWAICPSEGANKVSSFVTLFRGRGLTIAALLDYHEGQKKMVDKLEESGLLDPGYLLKTGSYADQNDSDIEDLLTRPMYIYLVNGALSLPEHLRIPKDKPEIAPIRVVKEVEDHCKKLPPGFPEFDHYLPADYLLKLSEKEIDTLPNFDKALDNFERLFADLNKLIKAN